MNNHHWKLCQLGFSSRCIWCAENRMRMWFFSEAVQIFLLVCLRRSFQGTYPFHLLSSFVLQRCSQYSISFSVYGESNSGIFFSHSDNVHMCFFSSFFLDQSYHRCLPVNVFEEPTFSIINFSLISTLQMSFLILTISFFILIVCDVLIHNVNIDLNENLLIF